MALARTPLPVLWPKGLHKALLRLAREVDGLFVCLLGVVAGLRARGQPGGGRHVTHVIYSLEAGGAQRQFLELARRAGGWASNFVSLTDKDGPFLTTVDKLGVAQLYQAFRRTVVVHSVAYVFPNTLFVLALWRQLRRWRSACVWGWQFLANVVAAPAARLAGVPRVVIRVENLSAWKTWPPHKHWWNRWADRNAARLADVVVVNAEALVEDYAAWAGVDRDKTVVVHNGVDAEGWLARPWQDRRQELGIAPGQVVVLTMGRLAREKNQELLLRACAAVHDRGLPHHLVLVGDGELQAVLERRAQELGLRAWVHFVGATSTPQDYYRSADVFALSSDIEGLPNVLLEAQVFGLPAVTTAAGGAGEVVVDGETGFVVPCGQVDGLAAALARLLADPQLRQQLGSAGQRRVRREFSVDRWVRRIEELSSPEEAAMLAEEAEAQR